jgi:hypothetical protein
MRIELSGNFLSYMKFITENFWEINIKTDKEGMHIAEQAKGGHYGIIFDYKKKGMKDDIFRLDCEGLFKVLKLVKKDKAFIEFDVDERIRIFIEGKEFKRDFILNKIIPEAEDAEIMRAKKFVCPIETEIMTSRMSDISEEAGIFSRDKDLSEISLETKEGSDVVDIASIINNERNYHATLDLPKKAKSSVQSRFTLANIERLSQIPSLTLSIKLGNDFPLTAFTEDDDFEMLFILAPLIHD